MSHGTPLTPRELFAKRFKPFSDKVKKTKSVGGRSDITFVEWSQYLIRGWLHDFPLGFSTEITKVIEVGGVHELLVGRKDAKKMTLVDDRQLLLVIRVCDLSTGTFQEGTGVAPIAKDKSNYGGAAAEAESQGLRRAFAKFGVGLEMYLDDDEFEAVSSQFEPDGDPEPDEVVTQTGAHEYHVENPTAGDDDPEPDPLDITQAQSDTLAEIAGAMNDWANEEEIGGDREAKPLVEDILAKAREKLEKAKDAKKAAGVVIRKLREWCAENEIELSTDKPDSVDPQ